MKRDARSALLRKGFKLAPLVPVNFRIPAETWEKLDWLAAERGSTRAEIIRSELYDATKNAKPPQTPNSRVIRPSSEEWEKWQKVAEHFDTSVDTLVKRLMNKVAAKVFADEPSDKPTAP